MTFRTSLRSIVTALLGTVVFSACAGFDGPREEPTAVVVEQVAPAGNLEDDDTRIDFTIEVRAKAPTLEASAQPVE